MPFRVAICLLLFVAVPPIPGQAPDKPANKGGNPKDTSSGQQQPTQRITPAPKVKPEPSPDSEGGRPEQKQGDNPVSVSTVKPLDVRTDVQKDWMDKLNWVFAATLVLIGGGGVYAAVRTLKAIEKQAELMDQQATDARESAAKQGRDVQASIAEATRASRAMEGIAESMASNVESVRQSVGISREIADMQKLATELLLGQPEKMRLLTGRHAGDLCRRALSRVPERCAALGSLIRKSLYARVTEGGGECQTGYGHSSPPTVPSCAAVALI